MIVITGGNLHRKDERNVKGICTWIDGVIRTDMEPDTIEKFKKDAENNPVYYNTKTGEVDALGSPPLGWLEYVDEVKW